MSKRIVLTSQAQADLAALDRPVALRIVSAIQRYAETGAGSVKALHGSFPPEFRFAREPVSLSYLISVSTWVYSSSIAVKLITKFAFSNDRVVGDVRLSMR